MSVYSGDFLGFSIGNIHSSQLNITRVSNNNRYNDQLNPAFNLRSATVPGGDGGYYWGKDYVSYPITIDFAFDDLRDEDIQKLRQVLGFKGLQPLIFDEFPYKKYMVTTSVPPQLKYIAFDSSDYKNIRVYKGEGNVSFVSYTPFALSVKEIIIPSAATQKISNMGDLEVPLKIYFPLEENISLILKDESNNIYGILNIEDLTQLNPSDAYICIDNYTHLIEGLDSNFNKTNTLYNKFIKSGDFFSAPIGLTTLVSNVEWNKICFNYLYY